VVVYSCGRYVLRCSVGAADLRNSYTLCYRCVLDTNTPYRSVKSPIEFIYRE
jgi:hypothetical protein